MESNKPVIGIITSRTCPTCGHHEIGYETDTGEFYPLRPGDRVGVSPKTPSPGLMEDGYAAFPKDLKQHRENAFGIMPWVPDLLRCHKVLRCKYGVLSHTHVPDENMSTGMYEIAYKQKLQKLITQEIYTPLSVIFDRYFSAPHLASGGPKQVVDTMWEELEEIRRPAENMIEWLGNMDTERLEKMILPYSIKELKETPADDARLRQELEDMSLEDFLEML